MELAHMVPGQVKNLSIPQLQRLAYEIRRFLLKSVSKTGGHLSSNLGIVELTLALHYVFNSPKDKIIFDVGHQAYAHKILTGRADQFNTLRQLDGLSGFQKRAESEHDPWEAGHSSTSLSAALGMAIARDLQHQDFEILPVIGDGALTGGMALEALNDIGARQSKVIIIFNDNNMSISENLSGFEQRITNLRTSKFYRQSKSSINSSFSASEFGKPVLNLLHTSREFLKREIIDAPLFTQFNLDYIGPVDGHDLKALIRVLQTAKDHQGPIVVHVKTTKGKGYLPAQQDGIGVWHGVAPFDLGTGRALNTSKPGQIEWAELIAQTLAELAREDEKIVAISPAMITGSRLLGFQEEFPDRTFDCGIAEQHAITMAGGMALGGLKPFVSIYSSFLQRAYDQIHHDLARMNLPVVVGVDHAGLVGEDGETHQGIYDIAYLRTIPNVVIAQPKDAQEARNLLYSAFQSKQPFFLRYPKGKTELSAIEPFKKIQTGSWDQFLIGKPERVIISYGPDYDNILKKCIAYKINALAVNARFFKPLDENMLDQIARMKVPVYVYEPDTEVAGLTSAILEYLNKKDTPVHLESSAFKDGFIEHGSVEDLRKKYLDLDSFIEKVRNDASR